MKKIFAILVSVVFAVTMLSFAVFADDGDMEDTSPGSRKGQLWIIISACRGNGEFSYDFQLEDGTTGRVEGKNGVVKAYTPDGTETPNSPALTLFANYYRLLTQFSHSHSGDDAPVFFGEPVGGGWSYEKFTMTYEAVLNAATDKYDKKLPSSADVKAANPDQFMLFFYNKGSQGAMRGVVFNGNSKTIDNLKASVDFMNRPASGSNGGSTGNGGSNGNTGNGGSSGSTGNGGSGDGTGTGGMGNSGTGNNNTNNNSATDNTSTGNNNSVGNNSGVNTVGTAAPDTGVEGVSVAIGIAVLAIGTIIITKRKKVNN